MKDQIELLENDIRRASLWQKKYYDLFELSNSKEDLATLQVYGTIITNLETKLSELKGSN